MNTDAQIIKVTDPSGMQGLLKVKLLASLDSKIKPIDLKYIHEFDTKFKSITGLTRREYRDKALVFSNPDRWVYIYYNGFLFKNSAFHCNLYLYKII